MIDLCLVTVCHPYNGQTLLINLFISILISVNSGTNNDVLRRVKDEVFHFVWGRDRCTWSDAQIEGRFIFNKKDISRHKLILN